MKQNAVKPDSKQLDGFHHLNWWQQLLAVLKRCVWVKTLKPPVASASASVAFFIDFILLFSLWLALGSALRATDVPGAGLPGGKRAFPCCLRIPQRGEAQNCSTALVLSHFSRNIKMENGYVSFPFASWLKGSFIFVFPKTRSLEKYFCALGLHVLPFTVIFPWVIFSSTAWD